MLRTYNTFTNLKSMFYLTCQKNLQIIAFINNINNNNNSHYEHITTKLLFHT